MKLAHQLTILSKGLEDLCVMWACLVRLYQQRMLSIVESLAALFLSVIHILTENTISPIIYGQFGFYNFNRFKACGIADLCQTVTSPTGLVTGSCSLAAACTNSTTTTCGTLDYANKQGPLCYVGRFGSTATPHACAKNQLCQVKIKKYFLFD